MSDFVQLLFDTHPDQTGQALLVWLIVAALGAALAAGLLWGLHRIGLRLLPPFRLRAVPWSGWAILWALALYYVVLYLAAGIFVGSGLPEKLYGPNFGEEFRDNSESGQLAHIRVTLWASVLSLPFQVAVILLVLRNTSGALPYQVGWTSHRLIKNILLGGLTWLAFMPVILAFNMVVTLVYREWLGGPPEPHGLERLAHGAPLPLEWLLLVLTAVVVAPVVEELQFRGLILQWASRDASRADLLMGWAVLISVAFRVNGLNAAMRAPTWDELALEIQPFLFALVMTVGYVLLRGWEARARRYEPRYVSPFINSAVSSFSPVETSADGAFQTERTAGYDTDDDPRPAIPDWLRTSNRSALAGMYASALLFACFHAPVWPSPVPLFVLGLVLAWLAHRTQSLVPSMVLHGLFNAVACLALFLGQDETTPPPKGNATTSAAVSLPSTWTTVPGSQLPRRR